MLSPAPPPYSPAPAPVVTSSASVVNTLEAASGLRAHLPSQQLPDALHAEFPHCVSGFQAALQLISLVQSSWFPQGLVDLSRLHSWLPPSFLL